MFIRHFTTHTIQRFIFLIGAAVALSIAQAHEFKLGDIQINHPYARATAPSQTSGSTYIDLENNGKADDALTKAETSIAQSVAIHTMEMVGEVMKMREVDSIELKAGSKVSMRPGGGYHIMLIGLKQPLKAGEKFPLTLHFAKAGKIEVMVVVEADKSKHVNHSM
jgi:copper(I)-binding protein